MNSRLSVENAAAASLRSSQRVTSIFRRVNSTLRLAAELAVVAGGWISLQYFGVAKYDAPLLLLRLVPSPVYA